MNLTFRRDGTRSDSALRHREAGEERGGRGSAAERGRTERSASHASPAFLRVAARHSPRCRRQAACRSPLSVLAHRAGRHQRRDGRCLRRHSRQRCLDTTRQFCCRRDRNDPSFTRNRPAGRGRGVPDGTGCVGKPAADPDRPQRRAGCSPAFLDPALAGMARRADGDDRARR